LYIFTDQQKVIEASLHFLGWVVAGPILSSFAYVWDGIYVGATATKAMRNAMIVATLVIFVPSYFIAVNYLGNHAIWLALTLFLIARSVTLTVYAPRHIFKS